MSRTLWFVFAGLFLIGFVQLPIWSVVVKRVVRWRRRRRFKRAMDAIAQSAARFTEGMSSLGKSAEECGVLFEQAAAAAKDECSWLEDDDD